MGVTRGSKELPVGVTRGSKELPVGVTRGIKELPVGVRGAACAAGLFPPLSLSFFFFFFLTRELELLSDYSRVYGQRH